VKRCPRLCCWSLSEASIIRISGKNLSLSITWWVQLEVKILLRFFAAEIFYDAWEAENFEFTILYLKNVFLVSKRVIKKLFFRTVN
jgi:hypothetical protein